MLIVLWEDEYNFRHKKPPEGSINLRSFSSCFCFALVSKTGPTALVLPTRTAHLQGRSFRVFWVHQDAHTSPIIFFAHVRYFGHGDCKKMLNFSFGGVE